ARASFTLPSLTARRRSRSIADQPPGGSSAARTTLAGTRRRTAERRSTTRGTCLGIGRTYRPGLGKSSATPCSFRDGPDDPEERRRPVNFTNPPVRGTGLGGHEISFFPAFRPYFGAFGGMVYSSLPGGTPQMGRTGIKQATDGSDAANRGMELLRLLHVQLSKRSVGTLVLGQRTKFREIFFEK